MSEALECLQDVKDYIEDNITTKHNHVEPELETIKQALQRLGKYEQALQTIINRFIWIEPNGEIRVGKFGDIEIPLEYDDFESSREIDNLKEVLKC